MFRETTRQLSTRGEGFMPVLDPPFTLLRERPLAVKTFAATRDDRPGDSIPLGEVSTRGVDACRIRPELGDSAQDLMAKDRRHRLPALSLNRMKITAAERAGEHLHENLGPLGCRSRKLPDLQRKLGTVKNKSPRGPAQGVAPVRWKGRSTPSRLTTVNRARFVPESSKSMVATQGFVVRSVFARSVRRESGSGRSFPRLGPRSR